MRAEDPGELQSGEMLRRGLTLGHRLPGIGFPDLVDTLREQTTRSTAQLGLVRWRHHVQQPEILLLSQDRKRLTAERRCDDHFEEEPFDGARTLFVEFFIQTDDAAERG